MELFITFKLYRLSQSGKLKTEVSGIMILKTFTDNDKQLCQDKL